MKKIDRLDKVLEDAVRMRTMAVVIDKLRRIATGLDVEVANALELALDVALQNKA